GSICRGVPRALASASLEHQRLTAPTPGLSSPSVSKCLRSSGVMMTSRKRSSAVDQEASVARCRSSMSTPTRWRQPATSAMALEYDRDQWGQRSSHNSRARALSRVGSVSVRRTTRGWSSPSTTTRSKTVSLDIERRLVHRDDGVAPPGARARDTLVARHQGSGTDFSVVGDDRPGQHVGARTDRDVVTDGYLVEAQQAVMKEVRLDVGVTSHDDVVANRDQVGVVEVPRLAPNVVSDLGPHRTKEDVHHGCAEQGRGGPGLGEAFDEGPRNFVAPHEGRPQGMLALSNAADENPLGGDRDSQGAQ